MGSQKAIQTPFRAERPKMPIPGKKKQEKKSSDIKNNQNQNSQVSEKEITKMSSAVLEQNETETSNTQNVNVVLKTTALKPKQKFLNIDTGEYDDLEVKSVRYELPNFDRKDAAKNGYTEEQFEEALYNAVLSLVSPRSEQIKALGNYATSKSYQDGKAAALASGNYLTSDVMDNICGIMSAMPQFAELKKSEMKDRWLAGFRAGKEGPKKILADALRTAEYPADF